MKGITRASANEVALRNRRRAKSTHIEIVKAAVEINKPSIDIGIRMKLSDPGTPSRNANRNHAPIVEANGHQRQS
jgi:hypothetical protein